VKVLEVDDALGLAWKAHKQTETATACWRNVFPDRTRGLVDGMLLTCFDYPRSFYAMYNTLLMFLFNLVMTDTLQILTP
jgi:hypothetical protein